MSPELQRQFEQAAECLEDARILLENDRLAAAVTRIYYAMFHAATGALLAKGVQRRSHHALLAAFGQNFVKTGPLDERFYRTSEPLLNVASRPTTRPSLTSTIAPPPGFWAKPWILSALAEGPRRSSGPLTAQISFNAR